MSGGLTQRCLNEGQLGAPDAEPSDMSKTGHGGAHWSTLGPAPPGVWRTGSKIPSYGSTHQEGHFHAIRPERRFDVTRIVAPAEMPCVGPSTFLLYYLRAVGVAACATRRSLGVLT